MTSDTNVIDFTAFKRPNSLAQLPVVIKRPVPTNDHWVRDFVGGLIVGVAVVKIVEYFKR